MGMYSERLLVRFLLDILKSSLDGLDNSAWQTMLGQSKGTQQYAGADKGRIKGYILRPSAVKINCKSFCEVGYANLIKHFLLL